MYDGRLNDIGVRLASNAGLRYKTDFLNFISTNYEKRGGRKSAGTAEGIELLKKYPLKSGLLYSFT